MIKPVTFISSCILIASLTACGGGSGSSSGGNDIPTYKGKSGAAVLSDSNKADFASGSAEVVALAITSDESQDAVGNLPRGITIASDKPEQALWAQQAIDTVMDQIGQIPTGVAIDESQVDSVSCGGSASFSGTEKNSTIKYSNYCLNLDGGEIVFNGTVSVSISTNANLQTITMKYTNFSMSTDDETSVLNGTQVTTINTGTFVITESSWNYTLTVNGISSSWAGRLVCTSIDNCEYLGQFSGSDGTIYQTGSLSVSDDGSGYDVTANFYHPDYGYVSLNAEDITLCDDGNIASGVITLTDENEQALTVTFSGCGIDATIEFSGVSEALEVQN